jgi:hypothetical protein
VTAISNDVDTIRGGLDVFVAPGQVTEVRLPKTRQKTVSGYYDDLDAAARDAEKWDGQADGIYFVPNPDNRALLARSPSSTTRERPC